MVTSFAGRSRRSQRDGYVLIITLVLITIAALSTAGVARRSLQLANEAMEAQSRLQRRWGATSCRRFFLENADEIFLKLEKKHEEGERPWPAPHQFHVQMQVAGMNYRLWLSDEDAKLNLNRVTARLPKDRRQLLYHLAGNKIPLQLHPDLSPAAKRKKRWFSSWGQVVNLNELLSVGPIDPLLQMTSDITCWGSGKLNIRRTSDEVLLAVSSKAISQEVGQKLLDARKEATVPKLADLLKTLALRRKHEGALKSWFTDRSTCFALWLELDDGRRQWYHQWVIGDRTAAEQDPTISFTW